jgi:hypothetical protein
MLHALNLLVRKVGVMGVVYQRHRVVNPSCATHNFMTSGDQVRAELQQAIAAPRR